jgi:hypothetical protein
MDWIDVTEDTKKWRAFVNTVLNIRITEIAGNLFTI